MQIYISKNNQQLGPFEEAKVIEMLENGQLSPTDAAIRQGDTKWEALRNFYPHIGNKINVVNPVAPVAQLSPKKSRKGLLLGCGGFLLIGLLVTGVLGFIVFRNMNPAESLENLPNSINNLKLGTRYPPKGNIWGTETTYIGIYGDDSKTASVIYMMTVYSDEQAAKSAMLEGLSSSCKAGEKTMYFSYTDKDGKEVSQGATCAVPLYVLKDNKLVTLGGNSAFIDFSEKLPFNEGTKMKRKQ